MEVTCAIIGCGRPRTSRGWCPTHYMRWYTTGDVRASEPILESRKPRIVDGQKECIDCLTWLDLEKYQLMSKNLGGRASQCRPCTAVRKRGHAKRSPLLKQADSHKRRAAKSGVASEDVSIDDLRHLDGDRCAYCATRMSFELMPKGTYNPAKASIDHVTPLFKGGTHTMDNTLLACLACNLSKGSKDVETWLGER